MDTFADRLVYALKQRNLSQAELCDQTGISRSAMCQYCSGVFKPKEKKLKQIAEVLGVQETWLLGYTSEETPCPDTAEYPNLSPIRLKQFPLLGTIACGEPTFALENKETFVTASGEITADFCLRASGDSMIGARIHDGDMVFIRQQAMVENGEIAAVIIEDEATLKRVYYDKQNQRLQLVAENPLYPPLVYVGEELANVRILGKAVCFMSQIP